MLFLHRRKAALAALVLISCTPSTKTYFPIAIGDVKQYSVRVGVMQRVEQVRVTGTDTVGAVAGYRMEGPGGVTRMAWSGSTLMCSEVGGVRFSPPLPLLPAADTQWSGVMEFAGKKGAGRARITLKEATHTVAAKEIPAQWVSAAFQGELGNFELNTLFAQGIGIVRQEEKRDGVVVRSLELD